jgi:hypothetical protein
MNRQQQRELVEAVQELYRAEMSVKPPAVYISPLVTVTAQDAALDDGDATGDKFTIRVPVSGVIQSAHLLDFADQGNQLDIALLSRDFTAVAADAAFKILDTDLANVVIRLQFTVFNDNVDNQDSSLENIGKAYRVDPEDSGSKFGLLHCQGIASGTPTYGAGAKPRLRIEILPDE